MAKKYITYRNLTFIGPSITGFHFYYFIPESKQKRKEQNLEPLQLQDLIESLFQGKNSFQNAHFINEQLNFYLANPELIFAEKRFPNKIIGLCNSAPSNTCLQLNYAARTAGRELLIAMGFSLQPVTIFSSKKTVVKEARRHD